MTPFQARCKALIEEEHGVTSIEYALLGALIAMVIIGAVSALGREVHALFRLIETEWP
ncbi:Flp family type IVb pilin [Cupriavidus necator]|uniref:Flp family type IVb pilin n=1 Tax=Cupriavidus necator TaxID=106590 RepID=UPI00277EE1BF|nr:Flp family type IVb pilin [Cupriavidus necator]MDQ0141776.1 pilus assembly protein Flp/PilA [Cupriavidus necator]